MHLIQTKIEVTGFKMMRLAGNLDSRHVIDIGVDLAQTVDG